MPNTTLSSDNAPLRRFRPRAVPTLAAIAAVVVFVTAGQWQQRRMHEKEALRAEFDAAAEAMVAKLAAKSGRILRLGKEAMRATEDLPLPEALEQLEAALARLMETNDSREGIRAFLEKRAPRWTDT